MPTHVKLEDHIRISASLLRRHGFFREDFVSGAFEIEGHRLNLTVDDLNTTLSIWAWEAEPPIVAEVKLAITSLNFGGRVYFECPVCARRCAEVHETARSFSCRTCAGAFINSRSASPTNRRLLRVAELRDRLLGLDGKGPSRGARRGRIVDELRRNLFVTMQYPDLAPVFEAVDRCNRRGSLRKVLRPGYSTADAFAVGQAAPVPSVNSKSMDAARLYQGDVSTAFPDPGDLAFVEDHVTLDVRTISRTYGLKRGLKWAHQMAWRPSVVQRRMTLLADLTDPADPHLIVLSEAESSDTCTQKIVLVPVRYGGGGTRWFMRCGVTGRSCDLLYLRNGIFASRVAQRLIHQSQRARRQPST